jgi:hypothetical protein
MTQLKTTCRNHPWRPATGRRECRLCIDQSEMRGRWKKIRDALRIAARYGRKSSVGTSTAAQAEQQLIISVSVQVVPFRSTHARCTSVPITTSKAARRLRRSSDTRKRPLAPPLSA